MSDSSYIYRNATYYSLRCCCRKIALQKLVQISHAFMLLHKTIFQVWRTRVNPFSFTLDLYLFINHLGTKVQLLLKYEKLTCPFEIALNDMWYNASSQHSFRQSSSFNYFIDGQTSPCCTQIRRWKPMFETSRKVMSRQ